MQVAAGVEHPQVVFQDLRTTENRRAPSPQAQEGKRRSRTRSPGHSVRRWSLARRLFGLWRRGPVTIAWVPPAPARRRPRARTDTRCWTRSSWDSPGSRWGAVLASMTFNMFTPKTSSTPATRWNWGPGRRRRSPQPGPLDCSEVLTAQLVASHHLPFCSCSFTFGSNKTPQPMTKNGS